MATINLGRVKPIYKGIYSAAAVYAPLDFVTFSDLTYFCIQTTTAGIAPTNAAYWVLLADPGSAGSIAFNNTASGLTATQVQAAIDELEAEKQPLDATLTAIAADTLGAFGHRNKIQNGALQVNQFTADAVVPVTASGNWFTDQFFTAGSVASKLTVQRRPVSAVGVLAGFTYCMELASLSAYSVAAGDRFVVAHAIEGNNCASLSWGTAGAKTATLSFYVRSTLSGVFGGGVRNSAANRSYPFTYTINAANTWERKTITIPGDTTGTWATDNTTGIVVSLSLGAGATLSGTAGVWAAANYASATGAVSLVGTAGAALWATGIQLEEGTEVQSFEHRSFGTELELCQRYYKVQYVHLSAVGAGGYSTAGYGVEYGPMRATPTVGAGTAITNNNVTSVTFTAYNNQAGRLDVAPDATGNTQNYTWTGTFPLSALLS